MIYQKFISQDPYATQRKALEKQSLTLLEIGRLLYALSDRRGSPEANRKNIDAPKEAKTLT
ncbi:MAG: hypothetical protein AAF335_00330 [Bacteroidota bacterium]